MDSLNSVPNSRSNRERRLANLSVSNLGAEETCLLHHRHAVHSPHCLVSSSDVNEIDQDSVLPTMIPVRRPPTDCCSSSAIPTGSTIEIHHWLSAVVSAYCEHLESLFVQLTSPVSSAQWLCSDYRIRFGRHSVEKRIFVSSSPTVGTSTLDTSVVIRIIFEVTGRSERR